MKRISIFVLLAIFTATVRCQEVNKQLLQLEIYLQQQGFGLSHEQSNAWSNGITHRWCTGVYAYKSNPKFDEKLSEKAKQWIIQHRDSINDARRKKMEDALDSIRVTFALLGKDASESYLYEYHKEGKDTIKYSLAFRRDDDTLYTSRYHNHVYFSNAREAASFDYWGNTEHEREGLSGSGSFTHIHTQPISHFPEGSSWWKDMKPFDIAAFEALLQPFLKSAKKLKGAKTYPVYWRHDEGFKDNVGSNGGLVHMTTGSDSKHTGLTTGTHYFIPSKYEAEAEAIFKQLDSLAYDYVNRHPDQPYVYHFSSHFPDQNLNDIVEGVKCYDSDEYNFCCMRNEDGFHILSITTKGERWVPREWPKLKSYINGEKVFR